MSTKIAKFEKVSYKEFEKSMIDITDSVKDYNNEYDIISLPTRATKGSAGYDIIAPFNINLKPGESAKIPTGLKCQINNGWFLGLFSKSGLGFKYHARLGNSVGIIDEDYYNNADNEGHIWVKLCNDGNKILHIDAGKAFCQGIFLPYGITSDDASEGNREGGLGSTNK